MKAVIYARCSTDEKKQDVELQLQQLRAYCVQNNWEYDEFSEYHSAYRKGVPPKLQEILNLIGDGAYQVMVVYNLDRFSRLNPSTTEKLLSFIVSDKHCRFIALQQNLDSDNPMLWFSFKGIWAYFSNMYSQNLSERTRAGIARKKEKGEWKGGRPKGSKDKKSRLKKGYYTRQRRIKLK